MRHAWLYTLVCVPYVIHGPIPEKYNVLYIRGAVAVWGWYSARMLTAPS